MAPISLNLLALGSIVLQGTVALSNDVSHIDRHLTAEIFKRADIVCPDDTNKDFADSSGNSYRLDCATTTGGGILAFTYTGTIQECANACGVYNTYNSVPCAFAIRHNNGDGACYLKGAGNTESGDTTYDTAALVQAADPPATPPAVSHPPSCPFSNATYYPNQGQDIYEITCESDATGGNIGYTYGTTFSECMSFCSQFNSDNANVYYCGGAVHEDDNGGCYLKGSGQSPSAPANTGFEFFRLSTTFPDCPNNNGFAYQGPTDGRVFTTHCGAAANGYSSLETTTQSSDIACINRCDANPDCIVAIYKSSNQFCTLGAAGAGPYAFPADSTLNSYATNDTVSTSSSSSSSISSTASPSSSSVASVASLSITSTSSTSSSSRALVASSSMTSMSSSASSSVASVAILSVTSSLNTLTFSTSSIAT